MSDYGDDMRAAARKSREEVEPKRMAFARDLLRAANASIFPGPDPKSWTVKFPNGKRFHYWPYSGWFNGPAQGRGIQNLLKAGGAK